jgi:AraC-like DNA-binding protein
MEDLSTLLGTLAVAQAVLLAVATLRRPAATHRAVPVMAALLIAGAGALGAILLSHRHGESAALWLVEVGCTLVGGPLFFTWVARVLEEEGAGRLRPHLVAPAAATLYVAAALLSRRWLGVTLPQPSIVAVLVFQVGYTAAAAALVLRRWRQPEAIGRRRFIALLVLLLAVVHLASFARLALPGSRALRDVVPAAAVLLMYALGFVALRQPRWIRLTTEPDEVSGAAPAVNDDAPQPNPELSANASSTTAERPRYESSPLRPEQIAELRERLRAHLESARPHLRGDLTLRELARELDTQPNHLSRAVNETGESFPDLLARHRVEEAKRLLADRGLDHLTVDALGARAGFRSRSAFYEAFRRHTGVTPSAFRNAGRDGDASGIDPEAG